MISLTIGLLLLAGLTTLFVNMNRNRAELDRAGRQIENGRYAMQILNTDIQHAGFYGQYSNFTAPAIAPDACLTTVAGLRDGIALPIFGYSQPITAPSCLSSAGLVTGNDVLVIRRANSQALTLSSPGTAGKLYLQSTPDTCVLGTTADTVYTVGSPCSTGKLQLLKVDGATPADIREYEEHIYFIGSTNGVPTLKRLEYRSSGFTTVPLVDGIERMIVDYGIDTNNDGAPDEYARDPATVATPLCPEACQWFNVVSVRISLLARNTEATPRYSDGKTYTLGDLGSVGPFNDSFKRHAYTMVVRAVNVGIRREVEP